ncbi:uncharacterized protein LOC109201766 [Oreochromis niloticus]|nr:uncharacterized protein LOC109201766 [Oreochromis niloticus]
MSFEWVEDDGLPAGIFRVDDEGPEDGETYAMYHGTTSANARSILASGFCRSSDGMLGPGVYLSRDLDKASRYPMKHPVHDKVVIRVKVNVGRVKAIDRQNHPLQKTWHDHGYDTAWVPPNCGMVRSGLEEDCVWDPKRITVIDIIKPKPVQGAGGSAWGYRRIFEIEGRPVPHEMIFVDEAGFNLTKRRKRGRNIIGHRAIVNVPGQRGGNVTMCAAISQRGLDYREPAQPEQPHYVVVWDNVSFHRAALAMEEACLDISVDACQGWIRHARGFYPRCLAGANIACDVDEILWPDPDQRQDAVKMSFQWAEDDFLPPGVVRVDREGPRDGKTYVMYHGTTSANARSILMTGFRQSAEGMLGRGVYLSRDLQKASRYPINHPEHDRVVIKVKVKVGKVIAINHQRHPYRTSWHDYGYDTAWVPPNCGMVPSGLEENCVWDPNRITIIRTIEPQPVQGAGFGAWGYR